MKSKTVRKEFLSFFLSHNHSARPSSSLIIKDDPSLLFVNAGMNQFKDVFLGYSQPKEMRIVNTQRCLRVSGKHNDLEEVGHDSYHHTMFEMLGNWSFGDYFKKDAIFWAWELLTEKFKIDPDRLYVTIFEGDLDDNLSMDKDAFDIWAKIIDPERIISSSKKDNFWEMGKTGPCGPCTEIHIDLREDGERKKVNGKELVNKDHPEVIEIWNLVFMEYNRNSNGILEQLANKHVDTGMGFERLCMVLQNKKSTYETDLFFPIIKKLEKMSNCSFKESEKIEIAFRVIVDHIRAVVFCIGDGQMPSNNGAGYVIRRILRRAIRYGFVFLDLKEPFLHGLANVLRDQFEDVFPTVFSDIDNLKSIILEEEKLFLKTLQKGLLLIDDLILKCKSNKIAGSKVFELYDRYGFPKDLTSLILKEKGISFDEKEYTICLNAQKERSRNASLIDVKDWNDVSELKNEGFLGYDNSELSINILMYREVSIKGVRMFQLVFNRTPFYPEGGGQVGDKGSLRSEEESVEIIDTRKENNLIIHFSKELPKNLRSDFVASVDLNKRIFSSRNHTATHLLHKSLRNELGDHVEQKGSYVNQDYLRFDFSHAHPIDNETLNLIEQSINKKISLSIPLNEMREVSIDKARDLGAISLFGEKYGDKVRVIQFGESIELCGGTHVSNTSEIGVFKIISEQSVASGVRRIEAITSIKAIKFYEKNLYDLNLIKQKLKNQQAPLKVIETLILENKRKDAIIENHEIERVGVLRKKLLNDAKSIKDLNVIISNLDVSPKILKNISFQLTKNSKRMFVFLSSTRDENLILNLALSEDLINEKKWSASDLIKDFSKIINGSGGGQKFFAVASSKEVDKVNFLFKNIISFLEKS